jgi:ABC-type antimicrobial peptide transport system permease subunit
LQTCLDYARKNNITLNSLRLSARTAEQNYLLAKAARLVTIFLSWPTHVTESSILLSFLVCFITGVFFGYYPEQAASRLDPIEALRYE